MCTVVVNADVVEQVVVELAEPRPLATGREGLDPPFQGVKVEAGGGALVGGVCVHFVLHATHLSVQLLPRCERDHSWCEDGPTPGAQQARGGPSAHSHHDLAGGLAGTQKLISLLDPVERDLVADVR